MELVEFDGLRQVGMSSETVDKTGKVAWRSEAEVLARSGEWCERLDRLLSEGAVEAQA